MSYKMSLKSNKHDDIDAKDLKPQMRKPHLTGMQHLETMLSFKLNSTSMPLLHLCMPKIFFKTHAVPLRKMKELSVFILEIICSVSPKTMWEKLLKLLYYDIGLISVVSANL